MRQAPADRLPAMRAPSPAVSSRPTARPFVLDEAPERQQSVAAHRRLPYRPIAWEFAWNEGVGSKPGMNSSASSTRSYSKGRLSAALGRCLLSLFLVELG